MSSLAPILLPCDRDGDRSREKGLSMDDLLPDTLLVEIIVRLPCYKFAHRCKLVSKRWRNLMSDPYLIGRFVCVQSEFQQQEKQMVTLINKRGEEFLNRMSNPLKPFFQKLMAANNLEQVPFVAGTYNDLLLCHVGDYGDRKYYICNPFIQQWTPLPPPPPCPEDARALPEGFMCDLPYYYTNKCYSKAAAGHVVQQLNTQYRCRVVRLISPGGDIVSNRFTVHIFSSETGEWGESIVSSPQDIQLGHLSDDCYANSHNRMLYWESYHSFIIFFDPFMISSSTTSKEDGGGGTVDDHTYKCRLINFYEPSNFNERFLPVCLGVHGGGLKIVQQDGITNSVFILDWNDQEIHAGFKKFALEHWRRYSFHSDMIPDEDSIVESIGLDPNNEEIMYLSIDRKIFMLNLGTGMWQATGMAIRFTPGCHFWYHFAFTLPWWPTPVPILPQHALSVETRDL